jgi:hypothetical protein
MQVNVHEAKTHLSRLLERVSLGEEVVINLSLAKWKTAFIDEVSSRHACLSVGGRSVPDRRIMGERSHFIAKQLRIGQIAVLPIHARHAFRTGAMPLHHAQSLEEGVPLISRDPLFSAYPIERIW